MTNPIYHHYTRLITLQNRQNCRHTKTHKQLSYTFAAEGGF